MGIWIRSQDKEKLINVNEHFSIEYTDVGMDKTQLKSIKYAIWGDNIKLGIYSTKEKALKVLDMIERKICDSNVYNIQDGDYGDKHFSQLVSIFQMPQDEV